MMVDSHYFVGDIVVLGGGRGFRVCVCVCVCVHVCSCSHSDFACLRLFIPCIFMILVNFFR